MATNSYSKKEENEAPFLKRFLIYQKERFPFFIHGLLVAAFSFSAISYSRICRGVEGFIPMQTYIIGVIITITLFFLVRIFDEFKDAQDDAKYRSELPVPRGLMSLKELGIIGVFIAILHVILNLVFFPSMLWVYFVVIAYLLLMGKEFFIADWLKKRQFWYITSHMFIIPLIDIYASGLDWMLEGVSPPKGLLFFFAVSYMNGIVLELGRKIKIKEHESEGVLSYTSMLGEKKAIYLWLVVLFITFILAFLACQYAGFGATAFIILVALFMLCSIPAWAFLKKPTKKSAKQMEIVSGAWTIAMYLTLGGVPMLQELLSNL